jgi:tetratricopeptide (TPR) repeat protein
MDLSFSAEEHFRRGQAALEAEQVADALENFRAAQRLDPGNARFRSYCGLAVGLSERRFDKALELCRSAAKEEFFNPDLYYNLARVHLAFGFKSEAIRYLRRALMIQPDHERTLSELSRLGLRRRPVLAFLRRSNLLNRWVGRLGKWLGRGAAQPEPLPPS